MNRHTGRLRERESLNSWQSELLLWGISSGFPLASHFYLPGSQFISVYLRILKRAISRTWFPQLWGLAGLKSLEQTKLRLRSGLGAGEGDEAAAPEQNSFSLGKPRFCSKDLSVIASCSTALPYKTNMREMYFAVHYLQNVSDTNTFIIKT